MQPKLLSFIGAIAEGAEQSDKEAIVSSLLKASKLDLSEVENPLIPALRIVELLGSREFEWLTSSLKVEITSLAKRLIPLIYARNAKGTRITDTTKAEFLENIKEAKKLIDGKNKRRPDNALKWNMEIIESGVNLMSDTAEESFFRLERFFRLTHNRERRIRWDRNTP
jgi:type I site-specific restriction endonuclease